MTWSVGPTYLIPLRPLQVGDEVAIKGVRCVVTAVTSDDLTIAPADVVRLGDVPPVYESQQPRKQPKQKPWFRQFQRSRW